MRTLYICLGYCLAPFAFALSAWRAVGDPRQRRGLGERFGFGPAVAPGSLWVHAVSVGEVQAAAPLVRMLRSRYPQHALLVTTSTATGRARAEHLFGADVALRYLPYDLPDAVARFLERARPRLAIVLETELWPNLYAACRQRGIEVVLASARLSSKSVRRYRWLPDLIRTTLARGVTIAAQSAVDVERFATLGADPARIHLVGNIKFDFELPAGIAAEAAVLRAALGATRPVWVAGSTHEREEDLLLDAHAALARLLPGSLLILVPRHPPRFDAVAALLRRRDVRFERRSAALPVGADTEVLLVDTLGELVAFYAAGDVAFVGGSLVAVGGHNALEPAALGKPVLAGPYMFNAPAIARLLEEAGALETVADAPALATRLEALLADPVARAAIGARGLAVIGANRGALARLLALLDPLLAPPGGA